ncbi:MAG: DNA polymerase III subunit delta [Muribaculaceae bacterium]|nr:DNA polymerase III subunit delta [Muribaculaceae bacterium]
MKFSDVISHDAAKKRLQQFVDNGRIPHAILIEGQPGIGKFMLARAFAQYVHCENRQNGDICGQCPSCIQHQTFNHIDTHFIFPVVKRGNGKSSISDDFISEWREYLTESPYMDFDKWLLALNNINAKPHIFVEESADIIRKLNFTAHKAKYKIVLLWLPERMVNECSNKLLKLIEEPFNDTLFVMVSNDSKQILPTIYSRTQRLELLRLGDEPIANYLSQKHAINIDDALSIAHLAEGNINKAERELNLSKDNNKFFDLFVELMRLAYQRKIIDLKRWSNDIASLGREQSMQFLEYCQRLIRENFVYNINIRELNYLNQKEAQFSVNFARFITERNVEKLVEVMNKAQSDIMGNANAKIVFFDLSVKIILLLKS